MSFCICHFGCVKEPRNMLMPGQRLDAVQCQQIFYPFWSEPWEPEGSKQGRKQGQGIVEFQCGEVGCGMISKICSTGFLSSGWCCSQGVGTIWSEVCRFELWNLPPVVNLLLWSGGVVDMERKNLTTFEVVQNKPCLLNVFLPGFLSVEIKYFVNYIYVASRKEGNLSFWGVLIGEGVDLRWNCR